MVQRGCKEQTALFTLHCDRLCPVHDPAVNLIHQTAFMAPLSQRQRAAIQRQQVMDAAAEKETMCPCLQPIIRARFDGWMSLQPLLWRRAHFLSSQRHRS